MEIGGEGIDHLKFITWLDENIGPASIGFQLTVEFIADGFKSADRGCPNRHDSASLGLDLVEGVCSFLAELVIFRVHLMFIQIVY